MEIYVPEAVAGYYRYFKKSFHDAQIVGRVEAANSKKLTTLANTELSNINILKLILLCTIYVVFVNKRDEQDAVSIRAKKQNHMYELIFWKYLEGVFKPSRSV
jgi:hypothetical protein